MDLALYARVLWRFRVVVAIGLVLAAGLAFLSVVRVGTDGSLAYRQSQLWSATTRIGVTQKGFPWGRLFAQQPATAGQPEETPAQSAERLGIPVADPNRFTSLALLYSELATSDSVRKLVQKQGLIKGEVTATPLVEGDNRIMLPLIDITAIATSQKRAILLSRRTAASLERYVSDQQTANAVPASDRAILQEVLLPRKAHLYQPRSKTMPAVIFLAVLLLTVACAFLLENMRPRARPVGEKTGVPIAGAAERRSA